MLVRSRRLTPAIDRSISFWIVWRQEVFVEHGSEFERRGRWFRQIPYSKVELKIPSDINFETFEGITLATDRTRWIFW